MEIKASPPINEWHHVVVTWNKGTVLGYYEGSQTLDNTYTGTITSTNMVIGSKERTGGYFNGTIDEVAIYNRVLSANEIRTHYDLGKP